MGKTDNQQGNQLKTVNYDKFYEGEEHGAGRKNNKVGIFLRWDGMSHG